jgi:hypothetical protein
MLGKNWRLLNGRGLKRSLSLLSYSCDYSDYTIFNCNIMKGNIMTIDKSKLQICCICDKTIEPKYLGKDSEDKHVYWYDGNNALPIHDGRCCDPCNQIVVADRIASIQISQWERKR